ncbi:MAG: hypothetical protein EOO46_00635 [Flavobacterium sp.]|nr:MAG: hypothetical protein EOO46_00635 [Flavobacterium sp.]
MQDITNQINPEELSDNLDFSALSQTGHQTFQINTGHLFMELLKKWKHYERSFLKSVVEDAFITTLAEKKVYRPIALPPEERANEIKRLSERYALHLSMIHKSTDAFPFPSFFLVEDPAGSQVIDFSASCEVGPLDQHFPLFFALQLSVIDFEAVQAFLNAQLLHSFAGDKESFSHFLSRCSRRYPALFTEVQQREVEDFCQSLSHPPSTEDRSVGKAEEPAAKGGFTLNRQVLILYYMLEHLGVNRTTVSITDMARLAQGLTGRQTASDKIKNTDIYKRLSNPLKDTTQGGFKEDLMFVRTQFERLGLTAIADQLTREINAKD